MAEMTQKLEDDLLKVTNKITMSGFKYGAAFGSLGLFSAILLSILADWVGVGMTRTQVFARAGLLWMILTIPMGMIFGGIFAAAVARGVRAYMELGFKAK